MANQQPSGSGGGGGGGGAGGGGFDMSKLFKPTSSPHQMIQPQQQPPPAAAVGVGVQSQAPITPTSGTGNLTSSPSFPLQPSTPPPTPYLTPSSSYPPPTGPYHYHHAYHHHYLSPSYPSPPPQHTNHYLNSPPTPYPHPNRPTNPITSPPSPTSTNSGGGIGGAVLMDILTNQPQPPTPIPSTPPVSLASPSNQFQQQQLPSPTHTPTPPTRMLSSKLPKGRHLIGNHVVYDIDVRLPGEVQPQLEVTPITKYVSDPGLLLGRQIAVNRNYICYGLKPGAIRILNINTALRSLLRGHNQKVTDMAFFAEDVHLLASACVDGRVFVRKISEGPDEEDKPQIIEKIVLSLKMITEGKSVHPRVCWHPHKQEILMVAIGSIILKVDTNKVGKGEGFSAEEPLNCPMDKLIDGVQFVGQHDGKVTELSMCQWMTTRLASASIDGTVKVWEDRKAVPLAILRPHDGNPVYSVTFLTAPHRPDHIILITGGPFNQEVKIWASAGEEGWLLLSDAESWQCSQTMTLKSSAESSAEDAFFNQVVALPRAGLILLANAKKNAIYAIHVEYGPYPAATRMDYIAEFTVAMPILSLTGSSDTLPTGEHIVQVYCVQTQAIQQYVLDLLQCLPPLLQSSELQKTESNVSHAFDAANSDGPVNIESSGGNKPSEMPITDDAPPLASSSSHTAPAGSYPEGFAFSGITSLPESATSRVESRASVTALQSNVQTVSSTSTLPLSPRLSQTLSGPRSSSNVTEPIIQSHDHIGDQSVVDYLIDQRMDNVKDALADSPSAGDNSMKIDKNVAHADIRTVPEPPMIFKHPTHLVTPSEILSKTASSSENTQNSQCKIVGDSAVQDVTVNNDAGNMEVEIKVVKESETNQKTEFDLGRESEITAVERREKSFYSQASDLGIQMARDRCVEAYTTGGIQLSDEGTVTEAADRPHNNCEEDQNMEKDVTLKDGEPETPMVIGQPSAPVTKGRKQKGKASQASGPSSPCPSPFNSTDSSNEPSCSSGVPSSDATLSQLTTMQDMLEQLMGMQKEMQKQMNTIISVPVSKEGKRLETSLGRSVEKIVKANTDALWAHFLEESAKHEKLEREHIQQFTNLINNCINKDLPNAVERTLKKETAAIGPAVARAITPILEKSVSSAILESFQKGVGEKAVNQLEKSVSSKLESTIARQIQSQFQTSGKQALQDALRSTLEALIIPAFETSCKAMFEQIDATLQNGLTRHINASQQQYDSTHSPLAIALRDAITSVSSISQTLSGELADGQRKLIALAAANANPKGGNPSAIMSNGPLAGFHEMTEVPLDPTKELSLLISEHKYEEAFTVALHRSDVSIVSWLCSQVDLKAILSTSPIPLSQGVLLALLQQLACDIINDMHKKVTWMTDVALAINPADPRISMHVRPICDQVYHILLNQRNVPTTSASEAASFRILLHVVNSILASCK